MRIVYASVAATILVGCHKGADVHEAPSAKAATAVASAPKAGALPPPKAGANRESLTDMMGNDPGRCVDEISLSGNHTCFRFNRGFYWCQGNQVSQPPWYRVLPRTYTKLYLDSLRCGVRADRRVECWGLNHQARPGTAPPYNLIDSPDLLVGEPRPLSRTKGPVEDFVEFPYGYCALADGKVDCHGLPGSEPKIQGLDGVRWLGGSYGFVCGASTHQLWCWGPSAVPGPSYRVAAPVSLPAGIEIRELHHTGYSGCIVTSDDAAYCFGRGDYGQWGDGQRKDCSHRCDNMVGHFVATLGHEVVQLGVTGASSCALKKDGSVWCWGDNSRHLVSNEEHKVFEGAVLMPEPLPIRRAELGNDNRTLMVGGGHACVQKTNGALWCWGDNRSAQVARPASELEAPQAVALPAPRCSAAPQ